MGNAAPAVGTRTWLNRRSIPLDKQDSSLGRLQRRLWHCSPAFRISVLLVVVVSVGSAAHPAFGAAARSNSLARYFPSTHMYPRHYGVMPIRTYTQPLYVFGEADGRLATRHHFEMASTRDAFGQNVNQVVTITLARFRAASDAAWFRLHMRTSVLPGKSASTRIIAGLGRSNGRYVAGMCVSCGTGAPPLGQLIFNRGSILVLIGIQQADLHQAVPLARAIDTNLLHAAMKG